MSHSHSGTLLQTPLFAIHVARGARMVPFGGWEMPLSYTSQLDEHHVVRERVGIFDVSHMGQVRIKGPDALAFLQILVPGNIASLADGQARYTQLCNEHGGVLDDLIISRLTDDEYFAVVNASTRGKDVEWMRSRARVHGFGEMELLDESDQWGMIAVQGPEALPVAQKLIPGIAWIKTPPFTFHPFVHQSQVHYLSRTGYTGEIGFELLCPADLAEYWWQEFEDLKCVPCGLAARDSLRLEAGYCLYGNDLNKEMTPIEGGLGWSVSLKKEEKFIGRTVIEKHKKEGPPRLLVAIQSESRRPLRHGEEVLSGGKVVGAVTSGGFSPILNLGIGLALVSTDAATAKNLEVRSRSSNQPVKVVKPPFVKTSLSK